MINVHLFAVLSIVACFFFAPLKLIIKENHFIFRTLLGILLFSLLVCAFFENFRRFYPRNIVLLTLISFVYCAMLGAASAYYNIIDILLVVCTFILFCFALMFVSCQSHFDLFPYSAWLIDATVVLTMHGVYCSFTEIVEYRYKDFIVTSFATFIYLMLVSIDIFIMIMDKHFYPINTNESIFCTFTLFTDIFAFLYFIPLSMYRSVKQKLYNK